MRIIFLDLDGVIVHLPKNYRSIPISSLTKEERFKRVRCANADSIEALNQIILSTGAYIVISSSWRHHHTINMLSNMLKQSGCIGYITGVTPDLARGDVIERGHEINAWMFLSKGISHTHIESYIVLDDNSARGPIPEDRWLTIKDGWTNGGLAGNKDYVSKAIRILSRPINNHQ